MMQIKSFLSLKKINIKKTLKVERLIICMHNSYAKFSSVSELSIST